MPELPAGTVLVLAALSVLTRWILFHPEQIGRAAWMICHPRLTMRYRLWRTWKVGSPDA